MKKYSIVFALFLLSLFASPITRADDIATIRAWLDNKTDDATVLHGVYMVCLSLTRTGTDNAVPVLKQLLDDERFSTVARTALVNLPGEAGRQALRDALKTLQGQNRIAVIQTLGAVRDEKSWRTLIEIIVAAEYDDLDLFVAVVRAIGNIAPFPDIQEMEGLEKLERRLGSIPSLKSMESIGNEAFFNAASQLRQDGKKETAYDLYEQVALYHTGVTKDAGWLALLLFQEDHGIKDWWVQQGTGATEDGGTVTVTTAFSVRDFSDLVRTIREGKVSFKVLQRAILELKSEDTGTIVLDNLKHFPPDQQAALIRNLGARKDSTAIVPQLMELAADRPVMQRVVIQQAAIQALGEIGDVRAVDTILTAIASPDAELSATAQATLKLFEGDEFNTQIIVLLDSDDKRLQLAALDVIAERQIVEAKEKVEALISDFDMEIRVAAYKAYAAVASSAQEIGILLHLWQIAANSDRQSVIHEALMTLCRTTPYRNDVIDMLAGEANSAHTPVAEFCLDLLFQVGGERAASCIAFVAMGTNFALHDKATQLLGRWTTPEVAPYLFEIAEKHPNERYRVRTFSGYLRVIRQMGLPIEQKVQMAQKAVAIAPREADRQRAAEVLTRFQTMMRGTAIFDGETFDGWEFRGNEQWFRIEDGAIVGGTLEESIPHNEFLVSVKEYGDFTLRIECKAIGKGCNGGIQFRSFRAPAGGNMPNEMIGYQADMTDTAAYWGAIYDESRRNRFIAEPDRALIERIFRPNDWNEYEIVCKGNNIKLYLNGTLTVDYTEEDANIPARGFIGLQIHSGPPSETWYRNIRIEE